VLDDVAEETIEFFFVQVGKGRWRAFWSKRTSHEVIKLPTDNGVLDC
jgi:hypothetical protein